MICDQNPLPRRPRKSTAGYKTMGEVRLDDERPGKMGSSTRSNHQDLAVRPLRREDRLQWWWEWGRIGADLRVIWEISV
jgi:hypothetical protein